MTVFCVRLRAGACAAVLSCLSLPGPAWALQPLKAFVDAAQTGSPDALEARANLAEKTAGVTQAWGKVLPGLDLKGSYTRNQLNIVYSGVSLVPGRPPSTLVISPYNQWDGSGAVQLSLVDLASDMRLVAAYANRRSQQAQLRATHLQIAANVAQTYFKLIASRALVEASQRALGVARADLDLAKSRFEAGSAAALEMDRAEAEVQRQVQQLATADLDVVLTERSLRSLTGLEPDMGQVPTLHDDLHAEKPLQDFAVDEAKLPSLVAEKLAYRAARHEASAAWLGLVPTLKANFTERFTNATSFVGRSNIWALVGQASWHFDAASVGDIQAADARAARRAAGWRRAELAAQDTVHRYWSQVLANLARSRAARIAERVSNEAVELAQDRYRAGVVTQLDLLQAQRDAYTAEVNRVAADADLVNSRLQLRLAAGHDVDTLTAENTHEDVD
jgi:outer membrane protein TolC